MLILAPMAGVTDLPFRLIAKGFDCDFVISEMVSAQGLLYSNKRSYQFIRVAKDERPMAIQLFGHDPDVLAEAAAQVVAEVNPEMIDLNMGCPTPKIIKNGDGAALLRDPELVEKIVRAVVDRVRIPVSVKIRLGWDENSVNCVEIAQRIEQAGAKWITVHGRTRSQFYSGQADWSWIKRVKENIGIPVVGNGDVFSPQDARDLLEQTDCDHVMIGRGALGDPWIFKRVKRFLDKGELLAEPTPQERITLAKEHLALRLAHQENEEMIIRQMRSHIAWYLKGIPRSSQVKEELNQVHTYNEVVRLLDSLKSL